MSSEERCADQISRGTEFAKKDALYTIRKLVAERIHFQPDDLCEAKELFQLARYPREFMKLCHILRGTLWRDPSRLSLPRKEHHKQMTLGPQSAYVAKWFKGAELATAFGICLSFSRLGRYVCNFLAAIRLGSACHAPDRGGISHIFSAAIVLGFTLQSFATFNFVFLH